jgi:Protein kinase domain
MEARFGKYEIRAVVGRGATSAVYEAWDYGVARKVAIKAEPLLGSPAGQANERCARLRHGAQAAGRLSHPNVVRVFDYGETASAAYLVMEYIDGRSLKAALDASGRLGLPDVLRIMDDVLAGLQYCHERGVVHRDLRPANILIAPSGAAKITDFGIALIDDCKNTQPGAVKGLPAHMAPEQLLGDAIDSRADIYSAGIVLFQMLTGERPFEGSVAAIIHTALHGQAPRASLLREDIPAALDAVIAKAMSKQPQQRFAGAAAFWQAMHAALDSPVASPLGASPMDRRDPARPMASIEMSTASGEMPAASVAAGAYTSFDQLASDDRRLPADGFVAARRLASAERFASPEGPAQPARFAAPFVRGRARSGPSALATAGAVAVMAAGGLYAYFDQAPVRSMKPVPPKPGVAQSAAAPVAPFPVTAPRTASSDPATPAPTTDLPAAPPEAAALAPVAPSPLAAAVPPAAAPSAPPVLLPPVADGVATAPRADPDATDGPLPPQRRSARHASKADRKSRPAERRAEPAAPPPAMSDSLRAALDALPPPPRLADPTSVEPPAPPQRSTAATSRNDIIGYFGTDASGRRVYIPLRPN